MDLQIKDLLDTLQLDDKSIDRQEKEGGVTFWLPVEYKAKYDLIQQRSKRRFNSILKEILKRSIDQVNIDNADSQAS